MDWFDTFPLLPFFSYIGVFVFSLSGGLAAIRKGMDPFGLVAVAILPGIGGGTLRDLMLDVPVFWLADPANVAVAALGGIATIPFAAYLSRSRTLIWMDAIGLALFSVVGASIATHLGYGFAVAVVMGTITATCGGLMRDIVCNDIPLVLQRDVYALAAIVGGAVYWIAFQFGVPEHVNLSVSVLLVFVIRGLAIHFDLSLPIIGGPKGGN